ncbi:hypothetical protein EVAR_18424_1 [Eumeta japonica]|uniref:Uncharacterized protein n=1 Tax=Eumeta variegata TaxID=151549 RepID=A0A4C1UVX0_EUMVA|nr:hypothetical protein EVAR_18424_1 [Eumeta japonica]
MPLRIFFWIEVQCSSGTADEPRHIRERWHNVPSEAQDGWFEPDLGQKVIDKSTRHGRYSKPEASGSKQLTPFIAWPPIWVRQSFEPDNLPVLYEARVRPHLEYCCRLWVGTPQYQFSPRDSIRRRFKRGHTNLTDDLHEGRTSAATTEDFINAVRLMINIDKGVTYQQMRSSLGIAYTTPPPTRTGTRGKIKSYIFNCSNSIDGAVDKRMAANENRNAYVQRNGTWYAASGVPGPLAARSTLRAAGAVNKIP